MHTVCNKRIVEDYPTHRAASLLEGELIMPEGATGRAVAVRKNTSRVLFAPETFNFAEVTRAIEVARRMPSDVECVFAGFSRRNSEYIKAAGFDFRLLLMGQT